MSEQRTAMHAVIRDLNKQMESGGELDRPRLQAHTRRGCSGVKCSALGTHAARPRKSRDSSRRECAESERTSEESQPGKTRPFRDWTRSARRAKLSVHTFCKLGRSRKQAIQLICVNSHLRDTLFRGSRAGVVESAYLHRARILSTFRRFSDQSCSPVRTSVKLRFARQSAHRARSPSDGASRSRHRT